METIPEIPFASASMKNARSGRKLTKSLFRQIVYRDIPGYTGKFIFNPNVEGTPFRIEVPYLLWREIKFSRVGSKYIDETLDRIKDSGYVQQPDLKQTDFELIGYVNYFWEGKHYNESDISYHLLWKDTKKNQLFRSFLPRRVEYTIKYVALDDGGKEMDTYVLIRELVLPALTQETIDVIESVGIRYLGDLFCH